jgi:hypothetical protein
MQLSQGFAHHRASLITGLRSSQGLHPVQNFDSRGFFRRGESFRGSRFGEMITPVLSLHPTGFILPLEV